jgi:hypothetical protein
MKAFPGGVLIMVSMMGFAVGCDEDPVEPRPVHSPYASPTAPESLITNLQLSYRQREIKEYAKLLAPEFVFKFQPQDANDIGTPFWTRDQDSTGTRALLTTTEVSDIRINLIYGARDTAVNTSGTPLDSLKIRIITTDLQVDQTDGTTWVVTDQQDFFFRQGKVANGEDPNHWLIYEWDDLPSLSSPRFLVGRSTWGKIKTKYSPTSESTILQGGGTTWGQMKSLYGPTLKSTGLQVRSVTWGRMKTLY